MQPQSSNIGVLVIVLVGIVFVLSIIYMTLAPSASEAPSVPPPSPPTTPAPASASSTNSTPAPATPPPKARTISEWKDKTMPQGATRGKTGEKISDSDCKSRCIGEPDCVAATYSQWGDCTTWTNIGRGLGSDCCSGTALIDSDSPLTTTSRKFTEGGSYRCNNGPAGEGGIYRAEKDVLRHYVTGDIAASWDPNWRSFTQIDCAGLNFGSPMRQKT